MWHCQKTVWQMPQIGLLFLVNCGWVERSWEGGTAGEGAGNERTMNEHGWGEVKDGRGELGRRTVREKNQREVNQSNEEMNEAKTDFMQDNSSSSPSPPSSWRPFECYYW